MTPAAAAPLAPTPHPAHPARDGEAADAWARLRARWDVAVGSESERALAAAVLAERSRHSAAERRAAEDVLRMPQDAPEASTRGASAGRRLVTVGRVTADGRLASPHGGLDGMVPGEATDAATAALPDGRRTVLLGRRTYETFAGFWPGVLADGGDAPDPHASGRRTPTIRAMAAWLDAATKVVVSRTLRDAPWRHTRVMRALDPEAIRALKREPGSDILLLGSGSIVAQLTAHALIDEYRLVVAPVLLGAGRPLLDGAVAPHSLELLAATAHPSGDVVLRYAPRP